MSKIAAQISDYNNILSKYVKAMMFAGDDKCLCSSNMRSTANACEPEVRSAMINTSVEKNEEDAQVVIENNNEKMQERIIPKQHRKP